MLKLWLLSVVALNFLFRLTFMPLAIVLGPMADKGSLLHQTANAAVAHGQSQLLQFFGHAWATITAPR